jgi:hypothetical protein
MHVKLSKERLVYAAVLGVGLLILVVDRALLAPSGADAAPAEDYSAPRDDSAATPAPETPSGASTPSLANRLMADSADWQEKLRNGFRASEEWIPPPPPPEVAPTPTEDAAAVFAGAYTLTAVQGPRSTIPGALVNGRFVKRGEGLDGWLLSEVTSSSAVFTKGEARVELTLKLPQVAGSVTEKPEEGPPGRDKP